MTAELALVVECGNDLVDRGVAGPEDAVEPGRQALAHRVRIEVLVKRAVDFDHADGVTGHRTEHHRVRVRRERAHEGVVGAWLGPRRLFGRRSLGHPDDGTGRRSSSGRTVGTLFCLERLNKPI